MKNIIKCAIASKLFLSATIRIHMRFALYWGKLDQRKLVKILFCYAQIYHCIHLTCIWAPFIIIRRRLYFAKCRNDRELHIYHMYQCYNSKHVRIHSDITLNLWRTFRVIVLSLEILYFFTCLYAWEYVYLLKNNYAWHELRNIKLLVI